MRRRDASSHTSQQQHSAKRHAAGSTKPAWERERLRDWRGRESSREGQQQHVHHPLPSSSHRLHLSSTSHRLSRRETSAEEVCPLKCYRGGEGGSRDRVERAPFGSRQRDRRSNSRGRGRGGSSQRQRKTSNRVHEERLHRSTASASPPLPHRGRHRKSRGDADVRLQTQVAIKVVRDVSRYTAAAQIEADILREVNRKDRRRESRCVSLLDAFMHHQKHMCLVFECLGKSLYDVLAENKYRGFYMEDIVQVAKQGLTALAFMRDCKLAHTDLKAAGIFQWLGVIRSCSLYSSSSMCACVRYQPENILLQGEEMYETRPPRPSEEDDNSVPYLRPDSMQVKIIDFGSATFEDDYHSSLINTRQYRAPEVILDIGWDMASDMWSLGCILMELYTGDVLFRTHEHLEHLAMMERIVEPFPVEMLQKAQRGAGKGYLATDSRGSVRLKWPEGAASQGSLDRVKNCVPLESLVLPQDRLLADFVVAENNRPQAAPRQKTPNSSSPFPPPRHRCTGRCALGRCACLHENNSHKKFLSTLDALVLYLWTLKKPAIATPPLPNWQKEAEASRQGAPQN
ncbi:cmgc lammer [Cyclospora cayetanensis]|uniref:Cmgc lammer n=1 Tax=Cyclospora cayetanensis TaxID=88456 RepID=A0A1D3D257_9EIME|nr:cmgc lammer [Cyclospora cayetanensis]